MSTDAAALRGPSELRGPSTPAARRVVAVAALAIALLAIAVLSAPAAARSWGDGAFSAPSERQLIDRTNRSRLGVGLKALEASPGLTAIARWRSHDMASRGYFSHSIPPGGGKVFATIQSQGYCYTLAGENIGWNTYGDDVATGQIHDAFLASPGHRANILSDRWTEIGVGAYKGPDGKKLWTVLFADACDEAASPRL
jgi:uncharacterized protein YkwD